MTTQQPERVVAKAPSTISLGLSLGRRRQSLPIKDTQTHTDSDKKSNSDDELNNLNPIDDDLMDRNKGQRTDNTYVSRVTKGKGDIR